MTIENGRPADESGRLEKETAVYDLLEQLDIPFTRADHEPAFTMDACEEVAAALETKICKNLFLCNRQKTSFYLLLMPGDKPFHTKEITSQLGCARLSFAKEEALEQLRLNPDVRVALLDIMLPDMDGFEVCRRIRAGNSKIGIIMLTARTQEMDKVTGFMTGADDYVTKPFSPAELTARIDALYRRIGGDMMDDGEIQQPPFVLNTRKRTLEKNGQRVKLTQVEYAIIKMFMENPGKALSREEILRFVWGEDYLGELKIVDVNIRRLRVKIEDEPSEPRYLTTVWGYGYKWNP